MPEEYTARIDPDTGLNDIQIEVMNRLFEGETIAQISRDLGLRSQTVSAWKKKKAWADAARKRTEENLEAHKMRLHSMTDKALDTVEKTMEGKANKTQFIAADSVLDRTLGRAKTEIEVDNRFTGVAEMDIDALAESLAKEIDEEE